MRVVQIEPGADADLDAVGAVVGERLRAGRGRDVAADHLHVREALLDPRHAVEHALRMAVRGVDDDDVRARLDQSSVRSSLSEATPTAAPTRSRPSSSLHAFGCSFAFRMSLTVMRPLELAVGRQHQHALEAMAVHQLLRGLEVGPLGHRDQLVARRHDRGDRLVELGLEAQVAVGDDADDALALDDRQPAEAVARDQRDQVAHRHRRRDRDRILDHAALEALDLRDLGGLARGREVLVDDADAAFLRDRDREARLGDRVHRGGHDRDLDADRAGEARGQRDFAGNDRGMRGDEQDVVERERGTDDTHEARLQAQIGIITARIPGRRRRCTNRATPGSTVRRPAR
jgi:hypothetical protein